MPPKADQEPLKDPEHVSELIEAIGRTQDLMSQVFDADHSRLSSQLMPDPLNIGESFAKLMGEFVASPQKVFEAQYALWRDHMKLWENQARRMRGEEVKPFIEPDKGDKRFRHEDWSENDVFNVIKQSYLVTSRWLMNTVDNVDGLDEQTKRKVAFHTKQMVDAFSPSNFALTNPEVIRKTAETGGENLIKGLNNLLHDLQQGGGQLQISQTDMAQFEIGRNVATAPGKVVFENELIQLLQFDPTTEEVYERPLLVFPPWINKYYILDLREENSFVRWATSKGYTVFVVSWVNPDDKLAAKTFEDYMREGIFEALNAVEAATGCAEINTIGYCIGGTLLGSTLAYMAEHGDDRIKSATFFAAQMDFSEAGDLLVFVDNEQLEAMEQRMEAAGGFLHGKDMAQTFNMLRANDLIWSYVINNYMLGKDPKKFDLLFWNADATRMPQALHLYYLREFYQKNKLAQGELVVDNTKLDLSKVKIPVYLQASKEDHIAPYNSVFKAKGLLGGPVRFMVAGSGHIAGVINHPDAKKYQHWINDDEDVATIEDWWEGATEYPGSWWNDWDAWLSEKSGDKVPARVPGDGELEVIEDAPGRFVKVRS